MSTPIKSELAPLGPPFVTKYRNPIRPVVGPVSPPIVTENCVHCWGYTPATKVGLIVSSVRVNTPVLVAVVPTSVLAPLVDRRTSKRSGKSAVTTALREKKVNWSPFCTFTGGVSIQLEIVPVPVVLLKLTRA